jgi:hypothetical protein
MSYSGFAASRLISLENGTFSGEGGPVFFFYNIAAVQVPTALHYGHRVNRRPRA